MENLERRFEKHILTTILNTENLKVFEFRREDSRHLLQRWIIDRGTLIVMGDCYDSIYRWNDSGLTLEFLASCELDYFSSKTRELFFLKLSSFNIIAWKHQFSF